MVHLKSVVMKITYFMLDQPLAMFKTGIFHKKKQNDYSEYLIYIAVMSSCLSSKAPLGQS